MALATLPLRLAAPEPGYIWVTVRHSRSRRPRVPLRIQEGIPGLGVAGCTGLEPVASGVTGSGEIVAENGNSSQPSGMPGNRSARSTDFCPGLGGLFRRRVTLGLQSIRSEEVMWPRLLSVREAASLLGVCTSTVYKLCAEGKLRHVRISNAIRIPEAALRSYE
jgi:excisionase family DNA binding protein